MKIPKHISGKVDANKANGQRMNWLSTCCFIVLSGITGIPSVQAEQASRPNLVLITADNLGYGDVGCYGNQQIKTPHIDRLATQGVRCTDFYTASPTCTVSRACLLTGRQPQRHGLINQLAGLEGNYGVGLNQSEILLPALLKKTGYRTGCVGKWNIGFAPGSRPTERGFDIFFGHASGNIDYYKHVYRGRLDMHRGTEPVKVKGYSTELFADEACKFIATNEEQPFFLYLPFNAPHFPSKSNKQPGEPNVWQAPDSAFDFYGYDPATTDERQRYYAVVSAMDKAVGRVMQQLVDSNAAKQTLVVFYSDNGAFMLPGRGAEVASNKPLRDGGVTLWEGGIRVPCVVRYPGVIPAGTICAEPIFSCDWLPTFVKVGGGKLPRDRTIDGKDILQTLTGKAKSPHESLAFSYRRFASLRAGDYKIVRSSPSAPFQLFNLRTDISEQQDLAKTQPEIYKKLQADFKAWQQNVTKP